MCYFLHLFGCLYYCISDAPSQKHQTWLTNDIFSAFYQIVIALRIIHIFLEHANLKHKGDTPASAGFAKSTHMCVLFASPSLHVMATSAFKYRSCVTDLLTFCRHVLTKESGTGTPRLDSGSHESWYKFQSLCTC